MGKLLTKHLLENGQGDYVAQIGMKWEEAKAVRDLVQAEVKRQRNDGKESNFIFLLNCVTPLVEAEKHLRYAYDKRQQGRYLSRVDAISK